MTKTIYIVDDDRWVRRSTELMLMGAGYHVQGFASAMEFLAGASTEATACAIFDVRMPEIDGLRLLTMVRARGWTLPVIIASGHTDAGLSSQAIAAGAFDIVEKPYTEAHLIDVIEQAFVGSRSA